MARLGWDGCDPLRVFEWPGRRVRLAELDPDHQLVLEVQRLNNAAYAEDATAGSRASPASRSQHGALDFWCLVK